MDKKFTDGDEVKVVEFHHPNFGDLDGYCGSVFHAGTEFSAVSFLNAEIGTLIIPNAHLYSPVHRGSIPVDNFVHLPAKPKRVRKPKYAGLPHLSVHDLIPDFGSYIADVESNLQNDPEGWKCYQKNPAPTVEDVLCDFGKFPENLTPREQILVAERAAKEYCGG